MVPAMHRTLVVEDEPETRAFIAEVVGAMHELELVAAVGSCKEARKVLATAPPQLLLTDLGLPDGSGIELISELRRLEANADIVVITVFGDEQNVIRSIEAGADGYLMKGSDEGSMTTAIRDLLAGGAPISPAIARHLLRRFRPVAPTDAPSLSPREIEVLELVAKGFSFVEVADLLSVSAHTVTTHMRRLYKKLDVSSKGEAVYEALHLGLISVDT